jgi:uncharacterized protein
MLKLIIAAFMVSGAVLLLLTLAFVVQRSVLFPVPSARTAYAGDDAQRVVLDPTADGHHGLFLGAQGPGRAPLIIFAHGNGELADDWVDAFTPLREKGIAVLLLEYPGYGGAPGTPSEPSIREAATAMFDWATAHPAVDPTRIVAYGRSIGGGAAAQLAEARPIAALILESAFTSTRPLAARYFVPGWLVRDPFDNVRALRNYRGPLLVVHGTDDQLIAVSEGRALAAAVPGATFHELPCGHNDCPRPWGIITSFLSANGVL